MKEKLLSRYVSLFALERNVQILFEKRSKPYRMYGARASEKKIEQNAKKSAVQSALPAVRRTGAKGEKGSVLVAIIIMMPLFMSIAIAYMHLALTGYRIARKDQFHTHAQMAADAGIDASLKTINQDDTWTGTGGETTLASNNNNVRTTYETVVTSPDADNKTVVSTGRTYHPAASTTPDSSVTVTIELRPVRSGNFSIVTGVGGLFLSNSAKVLGGDVFVNGELSMQNSSQIGLSTKPVNLKVAHQNCPVPADPTHNAEYPRICNPGENGQPISISNPAWIYGNVSANNQTSGNRMSNSGLVASSGVATQALPVHDRNAQKAAIPGDAAHNISGADASCTNNGGTKTWLANTKITGDVVISKSCKVTIEGDVWITGKLTMENSSQLIVSELVGTTRPNVMIDGQDTKLKNNATIVSNSQDTGAQIISYWTPASCYPECSSVTGAELYASRGGVTIELDNSASGPHSIFYSKWTKVLISNSGQIGALVGQTVELKNSAAITFGTSVGTPSKHWVIDTYRRTF